MFPCPGHSRRRNLAVLLFRARRPSSVHIRVAPSDSPTSFISYPFVVIPRSTCSFTMATIPQAPPFTVAGSTPALETDSTWSRRKPSHLGVDSAAPAGRGAVLSNARSLVSNAPSANSGSSHLDVPSENTQKRATLERLRRKLGEEVPADAVYPPSPRTPHTPRTAISKTSKAHARSRPHAHTRSTYARAEDTQSITISISSDEGFQTVTLKPSTSHVRSPHHRSHMPKGSCHASALPPVPHIPKSSGRSSGADDDDAGLVRPRHQMPAGSKIGGSDFKAARRAKREGRSRQGEIGETVEMLGFLGGGRI
ncbi:hypothetical protein EDC04DRAFT_1414614 [Pisolithus marmoratus]|nr:hypothetical protein EDC04DRAFT_1414614 [Pisolithus marmoratus]